jgi:two-component system, LytTR family, sensor histidine kinase AlgZ
VVIRKVTALVRLAAINTSAALLVLLVFSDVTWHTPWLKVLEAFGVSMLFSNCIGTLIALAMPHLAPAVGRRVGFPLDWSVLIAALVVLGMAGSVLALGILYTIGYLRPGQFGPWFLGSLKICIVATLTFGIFGTIIEILRARLDAATLALRTKERDEADTRRVAAEVQLASLESRVQPHFLFNTLNSIAALIHDDPQGAERMTAQLASLLRSSLDEQTPLVTLDEELRIVRNYLDIERVRFGDRLRYTIDADEVVAPTPVPRLAVQTIVENSVKYAVSPRREGASIAVRAAANNGHVEIRIEDDGPGFDAATAPAGHGLALVRDRLAMTLGGRAALSVESRAGQTIVTLSVLADVERRALQSVERPVTNDERR